MLLFGCKAERGSPWIGPIATHTVHAELTFSCICKHCQAMGEYGFEVFFFRVCSITANSPRVFPSSKPASVQADATMRCLKAFGDRIAAKDPDCQNPDPCRTDEPLLGTRHRRDCSRGLKPAGERRSHASGCICATMQNFFYF